MQKSSLLSLFLLSTTLASGVAFAPAFARDDIMPPPSRAPRTPVSSEKIATIEATNNITGAGQAIDGQTLRVHDSSRDVTARLLGVVAPPLTTRDGVTARATLDALLHGQTVDCTKRDRDHDGSLVMSCTYGGGKDLSEALLFTGAALFSRTGVADNDLAVRYRAAEETAQMKRQGLWSQVGSQINAQVATQPQVVAASVAAKAVEQGPSAASTPATIASNNNDSSFAFATWLEAMGLLGAMFGMLLWLDHRHTKRARLDHELDVRTDRQVLAAALTGELAAARDICEARAALIAAAGMNGAEPRWPRLRTYIYQAHAEQIGLLGAVLARQVASIYGQMSDYGASNRSNAGAEIDLTSAASVTRALVRLCGYIEITLEGLAEVEHTGEPYYPAAEVESEETHTGQVAHTAPAALPTERQKITVRRIAKPLQPAAATEPATHPANDSSEAPTDGPDGPDGGESAAVPPASPAPGGRVRYRRESSRPSAPQATADSDIAAQDALPETMQKIVPATATATDSASDGTAASTTDKTVTGSRAARRTALQRRARSGQLFKAEQVLAEMNADLSDGDAADVGESKTA